ncbi:MAG: hypothetical protein JO015_19850 [Verrucomicrobia bacterium]|nr:hypothetical protein [Verrucomicrobiota bacterium]
MDAKSTLPQSICARTRRANRAGKARSLCLLPAETGNEIYDVACGPAAGQIFLAGKAGPGYLEAGGSTLRPVSVDRVDRFRALTVLQKDHLLFAVGGDGWLVLQA